MTDATYDDRLNGLTTSVAVKAPCRVATTAAITLSGLQTIDGVTVVAGDRVLVKTQADQTANGIYNAYATAWQRAKDFDGALDAVKGTLVKVNEGTVGVDSFWTVTSDNPVVFGTSDITFAQSNSALAGVSAFVESNVLPAVDAAALREAIGVPLSPPQGRLTLTSATPVLTSDVTAGTSIYYTPYVGRYLPIYDGSEWVATTFAELTLALDSDSGHAGYHQSGKNFDLFVINDAGTIRLASGPAWTSDTARADAVTRLNGILVNNATITLRFGSGASDTVSVAANRATLVGTFRASANGQTAMTMNPAAASGGGNAQLLLWNAYNRVIHSASSKDSTNSWSYTTTAWRSANNSTSNRISIVNGANEDVVDAVFNGLVSSTTNAGFLGVGLDTTSAFTGAPAAPAVDGNSISGTGIYKGRLGLGLHFLQAVEFGNTGTTFYGDNNAPTVVQMALTANYPM